MLLCCQTNRTPSLLGAILPHGTSVTLRAAAIRPVRSGSKGAALLALLQREEGASLDEMIERTGWQGHTVRAAMTGLRKKGHVIGKWMSGISFGEALYRVRSVTVPIKDVRFGQRSVQNLTGSSRPHS